jgi:hypothetical protein
MKKLVLTTVCALAMAGAAFAQGTVHWDTISPAGYTAQTNSVTYSPLFGGGASGVAFATIGNVFNSTLSTGPGNTYLWELLYLGGSSVSTAPTTLSALMAWSDAGLSGIQTSSGSGKTTPLAAQSSAAATVPWASGTSDNIMLAGWSENLGTTWGSVSNFLANWSTLGQTVVGAAYFGLSVPGYINPNAGNPGAVIFGGGANANGTPIQSTLTPLYLLPVTVVPEPTPIMLVAAGLGLLALTRRKKAR